jgi:hypothetical protein
MIVSPRRLTDMNMLRKADEFSMKNRRGLLAKRGGLAPDPYPGPASAFKWYVIAWRARTGSMWRTCTPSGTLGKAGA